MIRAKARILTGGALQSILEGALIKKNESAINYAFCEGRIDRP